MLGLGTPREIADFLRDVDASDHATESDQR